MPWLVSGASSGLGAFFRESLGAEKYSRSGDSPPPEYVDTIIHCAFDQRKQIPASCLGEYLEGTSVLTRRLLSIPHRRFVFISTVEVYGSSSSGIEDEDVMVSEQSIYGLSKLYCETMVRESPRHLILRCGLLMGRKPNSVSRIIHEERPVLRTSEESTFSCVLYRDILRIVTEAQNDDICGTYNVVSSDSVAIGYVASFYGRKPVFGKYLYRSPFASNVKLVDHLS